MLGAAALRDAVASPGPGAGPARRWAAPTSAAVPVASGAGGSFVDRLEDRWRQRPEGTADAALRPRRRLEVRRLAHRARRSGARLRRGVGADLATPGSVRWRGSRRRSERVSGPGGRRAGDADSIAPCAAAPGRPSATDGAAVRAWRSRQRSSTDGGSRAASRRVRRSARAASARRTVRSAACSGSPASGSRAYRARSSARPSSRAAPAAASSASRVPDQPVGGRPWRLRRVDRDPEVDQRVEQLVPGGVRVRAGRVRVGTRQHLTRPAGRCRRRRPARWPPARARRGPPAPAQRPPAQRRRGEQQHDSSAARRPSTTARPAPVPGRAAAVHGQARRRLLSGRPAASAGRGSAPPGAAARPGDGSALVRASRGPAPRRTGSDPGTIAAGVASNGTQPKPGEVDLGPGVQVAVGQRVRGRWRLLPLGEAERDPGRDAGLRAPARPSRRRTARRSRLLLLRKSTIVAAAGAALGGAASSGSRCRREK